MEKNEPLVIQSQSKKIKTNLQRPPSSSRVYACFFPSNIHQNEVKKMFQELGQIKKFRFHCRPDGFVYSYITYNSIDEAHNAIKKLNKKPILDKILKVSFAMPCNGTSYTKSDSEKQVTFMNTQKGSKKQTKKRKKANKKTDNIKNMEDALKDSYFSQDQQVITLEDLQEFQLWLIQKRKIQSKINEKIILTDESSFEIVVNNNKNPAK